MVPWQLLPGKIPRQSVQKTSHETNLREKVEPKEEPKAEAAKAEEGAFLDDDTRGALKPVLDRFEKPITLRLYKDDSELSYEDEKLLKELASLSDKVSYEMKNAEPGLEHTISIVRNDGTEAGLYFHGVPGVMNSTLSSWPCTIPPAQDRI